MTWAEHHMGTVDRSTDLDASVNTISKVVAQLKKEKVVAFTVLREDLIVKHDTITCMRSSLTTAG
jgi:hypothetical protein